MKPLNSLGPRCTTCRHRKVQHAPVFVPGQGHVKRGACDVPGCECKQFIPHRPHRRPPQEES